MTPDPANPQQRLSKLAVLALACSLLVCIPGLGVFGMTTGSFAILAIGRGRGLLAGRTAAIAAIVIGALASAVWVSVGVGLRKTFDYHHTAVAIPTLALLQDIDKGDFAQARMHLAPTASITDEQLASFAAQTRAILGEAVATPTPIESLGAFVAIRRALAGAQGVESSTGGPIRFTSGVAIVVIRPKLAMYANPSNMPGSIRPFPSGDVADITIVTAGGERISLNDPTNHPADHPANHAKPSPSK